MKKNFLAAAAVFLAVSFPAHPQGTLSEYAFLHPSEYQQALDYSDEISTLLEKRRETLSEGEPDYDSDFVSAVVFPEMMRYSQFSDAIEAKIDQLLHSFSRQLNTCSIGPMQMKPFFAVETEKAIHADPELAERFSKIDFSGDDTTWNQRMERIKRLRTLDSQLDYLLAFIEICRKKWNLGGKPLEYQLLITATAYNWGTSRSIEELERLSRTPSFPKGSGSSKSHWAYASLATDFYRQKQMNSGVRAEDRIPVITKEMQK